MRKNAQKLNSKSNSFKSIRVKEDTKKKADEFLKKINGSGESDKVTFDSLVSFFIENASTADILKLQLSVLTWEVEGKRIRHLFEKEYGKTSNELWNQVLQTNEYRDFASEHSRLPLPWNEPLKLLQKKAKNRDLNKIIKNDTLGSRSA